MKRFALGFIIGLVFAGLVVVILVFAAMRFGERRVKVADGSTVVLHLEGELPEQPPVELPLPFLREQQPLTMVETWSLLRKAAADPRVKALVLEPRGLSVGWGKLEELHDDVVAFKKSGKRSEEHTSELQSRGHLVCRLLLEKKNYSKDT